MIGLAFLIFAMKWKTAGNVSSRFKWMDGLDERLFEIDHETDGTLKDGLLSGTRNIFNKVEKPFIHIFALPIYETIKECI